jgi:hypothetical protein
METKYYSKMEKKVVELKNSRYKTALENALWGQLLHSTLLVFSTKYFINSLLGCGTLELLLPQHVLDSIKQTC